MNTSYSIAPAPKLASQYEWTCAFCAHEALTKPIFLSGPAGLVAAGSGCAAVALYGVKSALTVRMAVTAAETEARLAKSREADRAEKMGRYAAALEAFAADNDASPALQSARATYRSLVSHQWEGTYRMTFPAFVALVAETGELPG